MQILILLPPPLIEPLLLLLRYPIELLLNVSPVLREVFFTVDVPLQGLFRHSEAHVLEMAHTVTIEVVNGKLQVYQQLKDGVVWQDQAFLVVVDEFGLHVDGLLI